MSKVILITGASSGIGYQVAKMLSKRGNVIYGGARHLEKMAPLKKNYGIHPIKLDVIDTGSCRNCVKNILKQSGRIDGLINCAGYGSFGPIEEVPIKEAKNQLNVNVMGIARLSKLVLPSIRGHHSGQIIDISSVAEKVPIHFGDWYNVSKYAVEALSSDMRIELARFEIQVAIIEPGIIKTPWGKIAADRLIQTVKGTDYQSAGMKMAHDLEHAYRSNGLATPPVKVAQVIVNAMLSNRMKPRYKVGRFARLLLLLHTIIPTKLFDNIMRNQ